MSIDLNDLRARILRGEDPSIDELRAALQEKRGDRANAQAASAKKATTTKGKKNQTLEEAEKELNDLLAL